MPTAQSPKIPTIIEEEDLNIPTTPSTSTVTVVLGVGMPKGKTTTQDRGMVSATKVNDNNTGSSKRVSISL
jgi:hypothetical protein